MERKPGGYRSPSLATRALSVISAENHQQWFQQIWTGLTGASTRNHPAPYPLELAERLIRMFSFVGDTVLDPFMGTGTTNLAAAKWGRNSIGVELTPNYFNMAMLRLKTETASLFSNVDIRTGGVSEPKSRYVVAPVSRKKHSKRILKTSKTTLSRKSAARTR